MKKSTPVDSNMTKGELTRLRILKSTAASIAKYGFEGTSVTTICKIGKINRGLIVHYFNDVRTLFLETAQMVIKESQLALANLVEKLSQQHDPVEAYIRAMSKWHLDHPDNARFTLMMYVAASHNKDFEKLTDEILKTGRQRMLSLIQRGVHEKLYSVDSSAAEAASILYTQLSGVFLLTFVENTSTDKQRDHLINLKNVLLKKN